MDTMPKKKAAPAPPKPIGKRRGWLVCDRCSLTVEHVENPDGWPLHRCGLDVRPFARWSDTDPKPPLTIPSPLEGP